MNLLKRDKTFIYSLSSQNKEATIQAPAGLKTDARFYCFIHEATYRVRVSFLVIFKKYCILPLLPYDSSEYMLLDILNT
jgi:hypothetical protein